MYYIKYWIQIQINKSTNSVPICVRFVLCWCCLNCNKRKKYWLFTLRKKLINLSNTKNNIWSPPTPSDFVFLYTPVLMMTVEYDAGTRLKTFSLTVSLSILAVFFSHLNDDDDSSPASLIHYNYFPTHNIHPTSIQLCRSKRLYCPPHICVDNSFIWNGLTLFTR